MCVQKFTFIVVRAQHTHEYIYNRSAIKNYAEYVNMTENKARKNGSRKKIR